MEDPILGKKRIRDVDNKGFYQPSCLKRIGDASLGFNVKVVKVRRIFGRLEYMVRPESGHGSWWIGADGVRLM